MRKTLLAGLLLLATAGTAAAHAILMESVPAARSTVPPGMTGVTLRFNSRIDQARSRLELRKPGGEAGQAVALDASGPDALKAQVALTPGDWVLRWQVLAVDGHITRGDVPFKVQPSGGQAK